MMVFFSILVMSEIYNTLSENLKEHTIQQQRKESSLLVISLSCFIGIDAMLLIIHSNPIENEGGVINNFMLFIKSLVL